MTERSAPAATRRTHFSRPPYRVSRRIGPFLCLTVLLIAVLGPLTAPFGPSELVCAPFAPPSVDFLLGCDFVGRDTLSRVLHGGISVISLAGAAFVLAYAVGVAIGLVAGYSRAAASLLLMRAMDVLLAFPPLLLLLLLATGLGPSVSGIVVGVALIHLPAIARIVRAATLQVSVRGYVEAAVSRGDPLLYIVGREILPNIAGPIAADAGPRLTVSILLIAGLNFLGLGLQPPTADWAVMITENRPGLRLNAWPTIAPAVLLAVFTIGVNLLADAAVRSLDRLSGRTTS